MNADNKKITANNRKKLLINVVIIFLVFASLVFMLIQQQKFHHSQEALQLKVQQQTVVLNQKLSELVKSQFEETHNLLNKEIAEIKQMMLQNEGLGELQKVQAKLDQIKKQTENLNDISTKITDQLEDECQQNTIKSNSSNQPQNDLDESMHPGLKTATNYRIYAVNDYGVVLQDDRGRYIIARIGKMLPMLGEISAITASKVFVGNYKIIADPAGFVLNQTQALAAYH